MRAYYQVIKFIMRKNKAGPINNSAENKIVLYTDKHGNVELRADIEKDTLWATQEQIASIFDKTKQNIGQHIKNIFKTKELRENSVVKNFFTTAQDGKQYLTKFYNRMSKNLLP